MAPSLGTYGELLIINRIIVYFPYPDSVNSEKPYWRNQSKDWLGEIKHQKVYWPFVPLARQNVSASIFQLSNRKSP